MKLSETRRWPERGMFVAAKRPLVLGRVVGVEALPDFVGLELWYPTGLIEDIWGIAHPAEDLWFNEKINYVGEFALRELNLHVGDVLLVEILNEEPRLIFVGPGTDNESTHVLSSWRIPVPRQYVGMDHGSYGTTRPTILAVSLYQRGPCREVVDMGKTIYDRMRKK